MLLGIIIIAPLYACEGSSLPKLVALDESHLLARLAGTVPASGRAVLRIGHVGRGGELPVTHPHVRSSRALLTHARAGRGARAADGGAQGVPGLPNRADQLACCTCVSLPSCVLFAVGPVVMPLRHHWHWVHCCAQGRDETAVLGAA